MHTIEELRRDAGIELSDLLGRIFPDDRAVRWFYGLILPDIGLTPAQVRAERGSNFVISYLVSRIAQGTTREESGLEY